MLFSPVGYGINLFILPIFNSFFVLYVTAIQQFFVAAYGNFQIIYLMQLRHFYDNLSIEQTIFVCEKYIFHILDDTIL